MGTLDVSTAFPQIELGPGATIQVDTGDPAAVITQLNVFGTYYPPDDGTPVQVEIPFLPTPVPGAP